MVQPYFAAVQPHFAAVQYDFAAVQPHFAVVQYDFAVVQCLSVELQYDSERKYDNLLNSVLTPASLKPSGRVFFDNLVGDQKIVGYNGKVFLLYLRGNFKSYAECVYK